jgi:uncharacterized protein
MNKVGVLLSEQCNLNCGYCGMDKKSRDSINVDDFLTDLEIHEEESGAGLIQLDFFGGEPLLQFEKIKSIISGIKNTDKYRFAMPTNGTILTQEIVDYLNEQNVFVSISYDGLWQGENRPLHSGNNSDKVFDRNIHLFNKLKNIKSHTMIKRGCYNLLENHLFIMNKLGTNTELTLVRDRGTWDLESVILLKVGIKELFDWYKDNPEKEIPNFILFYLKHFILYETKGVTVNSCGAGIDTNFYSKDKIVPCPRFDDDNGAVEKIDTFRTMPECQTCSVKNYCKKGCLYEQIKNEKPISELCDLYRYIYAEISNMVSHLSGNNYFKDLMRSEIYTENN